MDRKEFLIKSLVAPACAALGLKLIPSMSLEEFSKKYIQPACKGVVDCTLSPELIGREFLRQLEESIVFGTLQSPGKVMFRRVGGC